MRSATNTALLGQGEPTALGFDPARLAYAASLLDRLTENGGVRGAALVVARHGQIVLERYSGLAAPEPAVPASADTLWLVASITKPVAATAIMLLVERGLLSIDEPIAHLLPAFGVNDKHTITIRHLLTHTSGLDESFLQRLPADELTPQAALEALFTTGLVWPTGSRAAYNNTGFALLGTIIQQVTGETHAAFMQREIFEPLGLSDTFLAVDPAAIADRLTHVDDVDPTLLRRLIHTGNLAGGIVSTAQDIAAFGQFFLKHGRVGERQVLAPATIAAMLRDHAAGLAEAEGEDRWVPAAGRGLAWRLNPRLPPDFCDLASPAAYGHGGITGTLLVVDPTTDLVIAFMANRWGWRGPERPRLLNAVYSALRR